MKFVVNNFWIAKERVSHCFYVLNVGSVDLIFYSCALLNIFLIVQDKKKYPLLV